MNLRPGDYILLMRLGEPPRLSAAAGPVPDEAIGSTFLRLDGRHVWEYPLTRRIYATGHGRVLVIFPAGIPAPSREFVIEAMGELLRRPVVH